MAFNDTNFNVQWDEFLEMDLDNAVEIPKSEFAAEFMSDPCIFDESFPEESVPDASGNDEVTLMSSSQFEAHTTRICMDKQSCVTLFDPNENPSSTDFFPLNADLPVDSYEHFDENTHASNSKSIEPSTTPVSSTLTTASPPNCTSSGLPAEKKSGFIDVTTNDVKNFNEENQNKNTKRKLEGNMKKLSMFLEMKNEKRNIYDIPMQELDEILAMFILSIRKDDGDEYETTTLRSYISTIDKVLKNKTYPYTISKGDRQGFPLLRETMSSKTKKLKKEGKGNKAHAAQPITDEEIACLYEKGLLGLSTPHAVLNTLWLKFTIHFGMRGVQEHYDLCWGDIKLCCDSEGTEYLEMNERQTKTRTGETADSRDVMPRLWATGDDRCPVAAYNFFAAKRPQGFSRSEDPFYLSARTVPLKDSSDQWFLRQKVGFKKLSGFLKNMCISAGFEPNRRLTNHSARKHMVQKLRDQGCNPVDIMQISGHKNVQSIINYSNISLQSQKKCSMILANKNVANTSDIHSPSPAFTETRPISPVCATRSSSSNNENSSVVYPVVSHPNVQNLAPAGIPTNTNLQSMFFGATLHISNLNVYTTPSNTNIN